MKLFTHWKSGAGLHIARSVAYFAEDRKAILLLLALTSLATVVGILQAWPLALLVDVLVAPDAAKIWAHRLFLAPLPASPVGRIIGLAALALFLRLLQEVVATARKLVQSRVNYNGVLRVRRDLFRKFQAMHLAYHRSQPVGDSIYRLTTDAFACQAVLAVLMNIAFAVVTLACILGILLSRNGTLTVLALGVVPLLVWANVHFGRTLREKTADAKEADSAFTSAVHRSMVAIGLVQAFGREQDEFHEFGKRLRRCVRSWLSIHKQEVGYGLAVGAILGFDGALILGYGGYLVHERSITPGELMIFMSYLSMMYDPLCQITGAGMSLTSGLAGARRVFEVLDEPTQIRDAPRALPLPVRPRALAFHNVRFEYVPGQPVLKGLTLCIEPGAAVAFVGASGVGKSTLLHLLPRFYDPTSGSITLDEYDLRQIRLADLRRQVALALQESLLMPTTLWENIAYGRPSASPSEIKQAARLAGIDEFIEALPGGYESKVAEYAHNLSGGQRQRIALARALLTRAPILILDEPTSAQDGLHESIIRETLRSLRGRCTIVLVSHRPTTVQECDFIYVLDNGQIAESGSHSDLLHARGVYYSLNCAESGNERGAARRGRFRASRSEPAPAISSESAER
jgi:ABC-type multidrug transport system fused ATPase/permease subunit